MRGAAMLVLIGGYALVFLGAGALDWRFGLVALGLIAILEAREVLTALF